SYNACFLFAFAVLSVTAACAERSKSASTKAKPHFPELTIKQKLQAESAGGSQSLRPSRLLENRGNAEFALPTALTYANNGDLYILDNNGHAVHRWSGGETKANVFLMQHVGALNFPYAGQIANQRLYISDNDGIKVFSTKGEFERLIRVYFGVFSFAITDKETFLISPLIRKPEAQSPLIVELDSHGKLIRGFGRRPNTHESLDAQAFLSVEKNQLFVAFKYRPVVEVYDIASGRLSRTIDVSHSIFPQLAAQMSAGSEGSERGRLPRYLAGIKVIDGRIFLCLYLPKPEIWEMRDDGQRLRQFQVECPSSALDIFGFDVRARGNSVTIALGLIDPALSPSVAEITTNLS
ncbi:MAG: hypothetical protein WAM70_15360, partial [Pyrinomonadaceae bacterium]